MKLRLRNIVLCFLLLPTLFIALVVLYVAHWSYENHHAEKRIEQKFWDEVQKTPGFYVKFFKLWEGDSMVTGEIKNKGEVRFWYSEAGVPNITSFAGRSIDYSCTFDKDGRHFTTGLDLSSGSPFVSLFGMEVNTLSDLVKNYDKLNAKMSEYAISSSKTTVKMTIRGKSATCQFP